MVAIYMLHKWWPISDVLKTSSKSRNGLVFVSWSQGLAKLKEDLPMCMIQIFFPSVTHGNKDINARHFIEITTFITAGGVSDGESYTVPAKSDCVWNVGKASG